MNEAWRTLWPILFGPTIWALHFLVCYVFAAVFCAKAEPSADFFPVRLVVAAATALALAAIAFVGFLGYRQWAIEHDVRQDQPTDVDRRQLLGQATILLCGLSALAVVYGALPAVFIASCW
jgi:hypothetical protein